MNFFDHKDLGNHLLQLCPKVVKHPVCAKYWRMSVTTNDTFRQFLCLYKTNYRPALALPTTPSPKCLSSRPEPTDTSQRRGSTAAGKARL